MIPNTTRDQRTDQARQLLEQGVQSILDADQFRAYLATLAKLHRYSWRNVLLMVQQRPTVTLPNSYTRWQQLGRQVRKGETGMRIFVPIIPSRTRNTDDTTTDEQTSLRPVAFTTGAVFDIAQTDGDPLPETVTPINLSGHSNAGALLTARLTVWLETQGVTVTRGDTGTANGSYCPPSSITLSGRLHGDQAAKTLTHEAAHFLSQHERGSIAAADAETVAESVAYVVLHAHGIDASGYSFAYVANWARERDVLTRNLDTVQKVAHRLLDGLSA